MRNGLVLDFDGVLTDGHVYVNDQGTETVCCFRPDSMGIKLLKKLNFKIVVISTEKSTVIDKRCEKMGIDFYKMKTTHPDEKLETMLKWITDNNLKPENVVYIGDDLNDLSCMLSPGIFPVAPANAYDVVQEIAWYVTKKSGGNGAVRELCNLLVSGKIDVLDELKLTNDLKSAINSTNTIDLLEFWDCMGYKYK